MSPKFRFHTAKVEPADFDAECQEILVSRVIVALFVAVLAIVVAISLYTNLNNVDQIPPPPQSSVTK